MLATKPGLFDDSMDPLASSRSSNEIFSMGSGNATGNQGANDGTQLVRLSVMIPALLAVNTDKPATGEAVPAADQISMRRGPHHAQPLREGGATKR